MTAKEEFEQASSRQGSGLELERRADLIDPDSGGIRSGSDIRAQSGGATEADHLGESDTEKPAPARLPSFEGKPRQGIVIATHLDIHRDHSISSENMGWLSPGDQVTIQSSWIDGTNLWGRLGPDRWVAIVHDRVTQIDLL
jgi:hypothetical protein